MERQLYQVEQQQLEFKVSVDSETERILNSKPDELLDLLFQDEPEKIFLLKGTGFSMDMQLLRWMIKYRDTLKEGSSLEETRREFINETVQDVRGFYFEYLTEQDIFPIDLEFRKGIEGQRVVFAPKYNETLKTINENLKKLTGSEEREGALAEGIDKAIDIMVESEPGTIVILNSPPGWTGMKRDGKEIVFPNTQTYVYWIDSEGNLQGVTIKSDIDLHAGEKLTGIKNSGLTTKERIKKVVKTPISFHATNIEKVLDLVEEVSGIKLDKQRNELVNRKTLFTLNERASQIVEELRSFLLKNISHLSNDNIKLFVKYVGKAILDLRGQVLQERKSENHIFHRVQQPQYSHQFIYDMDMYRKLAGDVQTLVGCNGGGGSINSSTNNGYSEQMLGSIDAGDGLGPAEFKCPACGHINRRPFGGYVMSCQGPNCPNPSAVRC